MMKDTDIQRTPWPKGCKFRKMVTCPVMLEQSGMQMIDVQFCLVRNGGQPCQHYQGTRTTKHGEEIICAVPKGRAITEVPILEE